MTLNNQRWFSAIILLTSIRSVIPVKVAYFHQKKLSYSLKKLFSKNKNWFCHSNIEEQRKSYINPLDKYTEQIYRPEDSVCIFMFTKYKKIEDLVRITLYVTLIIENIFWVSL